MRSARAAHHRRSRTSAAVCDESLLGSTHWAKMSVALPTAPKSRTYGVRPKAAASLETLSDHRRRGAHWCSRKRRGDRLTSVSHAGLGVEPLQCCAGTPGQCCVMVVSSE